MSEMIDFQVNEFQPSPSDKLVQLQPGPGEAGEVKQVNLNAVSFYARLGMKPRSIQHRPHVNCTAMTIFNNNPIRAAYELGKSDHEVFLRTIAMDGARERPALALEMLTRAVGNAEEDVDLGFSPEEQTHEAPTKIELTIIKNVSSDRTEIEEVLEAAMNAADPNRLDKA